MGSYAGQEIYLVAPCHGYQKIRIFYTGFPQNSHGGTVALDSHDII